MDPLALAAATAIMSAMATDAWQQARTALVGLWRRVHPERAAAIEDELAEVRGEILAAHEADDELYLEDLTAEWGRRVQRLLASGESRDPGLRAELQRVLDKELSPLLPLADQARIGRIKLTASASGHGRVYQAGRDQHITEK